MTIQNIDSNRNAWASALAADNVLHILPQDNELAILAADNVLHIQPQGNELDILAVDNLLHIY